MKKAVTFTIFMLTILAQQMVAQGRYNGYVITNEADTVFGVIEVGIPGLQAVRLSFTDYEVHEAVELEPFQVKSYYANNQIFISKIYDIDESLDYGIAVFMEELQSGFVQLYKYWNNKKRRYEWLLEDKNKKMLQITKLNFDTEMMANFGDCNILKTQLTNGDYTFKDLETVVSTYNDWKRQGDSEAALNHH